MAITINDETFVDGTFTAGNIIYGRVNVDGAYSSGIRSKTVTFGSGGQDSFTAGSGNPFVFITGYTGDLGNRTRNSGVYNISVESVTASGFTIHVHRSSSPVLTVYWMAIRNP